MGFLCPVSRIHCCNDFGTQFWKIAHVCVCLPGETRRQVEFYRKRGLTPPNQAGTVSLLECTGVVMEFSSVVLEHLCLLSCWKGCVLHNNGVC